MASTTSSRSPGRPKKADPKRQVTLRLDTEVVDRFRATGPGWQTRINEALRAALENRRGVVANRRDVERARNRELSSAVEALLND